jgi:hypothetical protein
MNRVPQWRHLCAEYLTQPDMQRREGARTYNALAEYVSDHAASVRKLYNVRTVGSAEPYASAEQMTERVAATGELLISNLYSDSHPFLSHAENIAWRTWHDAAHIAYALPFTPIGEWNVLHRALTSPDFPAAAVAAQFNEAGYQTAYNAVTRTFPDPQRCVRLGDHARRALTYLQPQKDNR